MIRLHRLWLLAIAVLVALAFGPPPITVDVSPRQAIGRRDVLVKTRVERHEDNRLLVLVIDGTEFRRQDLELNSDPRYEDPRHWTRWFKDVPPGRYAVIASVYRAGGKSARATTEFCLVGLGVTCE